MTPICVIKMDIESINKRNDANVELPNMQDIFEKSLPDYHVFCLPKYESPNDPVTFEVFHEKDFTDVNFEELRKIISESMNQSDKNI